MNSSNIWAILVGVVVVSTKGVSHRYPYMVTISPAFVQADLMGAFATEQVTVTGDIDELVNDQGGGSSNGAVA